MKFTSVPKFCGQATRILRSREPVLVLRRGRVAGIFLPQLEDNRSLDLRTQVFRMLTSHIARQIRKSHAAEEKILAEFKKSRGARRQ